MRLSMQVAVAILLLCCVSEQTFAKGKGLAEKAHEQLEKILLAKANAVDAVRQMEALAPSSEQLKELEAKYGKTRDLHRISAAQTADAFRGVSKIPPTGTESATEAANSLGELARFVQDYQTSAKTVPGFDFVDLQQRKSKLAAVAQFALDHRASIQELVKFVQKQYAAFAKLQKDQREALAKEADAAGDWPDFKNI